MIGHINSISTSRVVVEPGRAAWKMIVKNFGYDILLEDGHIDRQKLRQIVFQDEEKRRILNHCTHPYILRAMLWQVVKHFLRGMSFLSDTCYECHLWFVFFIMVLKSGCIILNCR